MREQTLLTPLSVAQKTTYVEWETEPSLFKHYPDFCYRISISEHPELEWIREVRCVTEEKNLGGKPYRRLNVPSAGNLHPIEMYLQIRNVKGILSGIYHVDVLTGSLVLIHDIERDGLETAVGLNSRLNGFIVFFTLVPFRSAWKYGLRAWRYLYLDLGHQIGAFLSVMDHFGLSLTKLSVDNTGSFNHLIGMGEDEFVAAAYAIGECSSKPAQPIDQALMHVSPCDYTLRNVVLNEAVAREELYSGAIGYATGYWNPVLNRTRRSAREFAGLMDDEVIRTIIAMDTPPSIEMVHIVFRAQSMQCGVYRSGRCTEPGDMADEVIHLLLGQRFITQAGMVSLVYAKRFDAQTHIDAGIAVQHLYMLTSHYRAGCSGIGAFYDEEASSWSKYPLIYAAAIGGTDESRGTERD